MHGSYPNGVGNAVSSNQAVVPYTALARMCDARVACDTLELVFLVMRLILCMLVCVHSSVGACEPVRSAHALVRAFGCVYAVHACQRGSARARVFTHAHVCMRLCVGGRVSVSVPARVRVCVCVHISCLRIEVCTRGIRSSCGSMSWRRMGVHCSLFGMRTSACGRIGVLFLDVVPDSKTNSRF